MYMNENEIKAHHHHLQSGCKYQNTPPNCTQNTNLYVERGKNYVTIYQLYSAIIIMSQFQMQF